MKMMASDEIIKANNELDDFLRSDLRKKPIGRYTLDHGIYANIDEYETCLREERQYETHRKYYDYQYIIDGAEIIEIKALSDDSCKSKYDQAEDILFYGNELAGKRIVLQQGDGLLIDPGELHMPCLQVEHGGSTHVKKVVVKIPISLFHDIKLLVMDVDGTLTDGKIYMGNDGELMKAFDIKDGYGINALLPNNGIIPVIITGRESKIVSNRCKELYIDEYYQGVSDKLSCLQDVVSNKGFDLSNVAYIGDDDNDLGCMYAVKNAGGLVACPANASDRICDIADYISLNNGGEGAVREFIDFLVL